MTEAERKQRERAAWSPERREHERSNARARAQQRRADTHHDARLRDQRTATRLRRAARIRALIAEAKVGGCVDCGRADLPLEVLDLDHVRGERQFSLAQATARGVAAVKEELAKCEVRCPTCHALRHYHERVVAHGRYH